MLYADLLASLLYVVIDQINALCVVHTLLLLDTRQGTGRLYLLNDSGSAYRGRGRGGVY